MASGARIVVGISGGVDSAVAALCLLEAGYDVHGLHMTNWEEDDTYCSAAADFQAAQRVCTDLGIPLHRANFSREYREQVFAGFLDGYRAGHTPNPDVLCNRHIKFGVFLEYARRLGATRIATGHYARLDHAGGVTRLLQAVDAAKDQTYFLHAVAPTAFAAVEFPLGTLTKQAVRARANAAGLASHDRPDSTGICFIGERPFREFLGRYLQGVPGPILTPEGRRLGEHGGLMFYTPGQRTGLGIGGVAGSAEAPWYVAARDPERNALIVVQGREHPRLWARYLTTGPAHWLDPEIGSALASGPLPLDVRIRHRQAPVPALVETRADGTLVIRSDAALWAPAPGQYAVLYRGGQCLGGAVIATAHPL